MGELLRFPIQFHTETHRLRGFGFNRFFQFLSILIIVYSVPTEYLFPGPNSKNKIKFVSIQFNSFVWLPPLPTYFLHVAAALLFLS
jgi:hypothetical protein